MTRVVGMVLVKNENLFIEKVVRHIAGFCDEVLLADHESDDGTTEILEKLAAEFPHIHLHRIQYASESHDLLQSYVNTPTWIFGVDGDELYDPVQLAAFRQRLNAGEFDSWWMIFGNVLNCEEWQPEIQRAAGFLSPPCRSMTKLYNFNAISAWKGGNPSRLHGDGIVFKPGFDETRKFELHQQHTWENSPFRCLHLCFVPRSSKTSSDETHRHHPEVKGRNFWHELIQRFWRTLRPEASRDWRQERYRRGPRVEVDVKGF